MVLGFDASDNSSLDESSIKVLERELVKIFVKSIEETAVEVRKDLDEITKHWASKPKFKFVLDITKGSHTATLVTDNEVWRWIDQGTEPHDIPGSPSNKLSFIGFGRGSRDSFGNYPDTYVSSSIPGSLSSRAQGFRGDRLALSQDTISHPGIEARNWSTMIAKKHEGTFLKYLSKNFALLKF